MSKRRADDEEDLSNNNSDVTPKKQRTGDNNTEEDNGTLESIYLSTIDRKKLDFDFEKVCSVTVSCVNIYGCLVCGRYFQGRGKSSPAFLHSINEDHHVFINFNTLKAYILPENKVLESASLNDIKYAIHPTYDKLKVNQLSRLEPVDLNGNSYKPGYIGLNNIKANDYMNVILQALAHTRIIQEQLLLTSDSENDESLNRTELGKRFTLFVKKLWSPKLFKNHISPHDVLQHIGVFSNKKFTLYEQKDPKDFLLWLLNTFLTDKVLKPVITNSFRGRLKIRSRKLSTEEPGQNQPENGVDHPVNEIITKFWILTFDLPSASFFEDGSNVDKIPQIKLSTLLEKYNGQKEHVSARDIRTYAIEKYPPYLIFHFNRFKDSKLEIDLSNKERNQTIIEFPLELSFQNDTIKYKLVSNITHNVVQNSTYSNSDYQSKWSVQLRNKEEWFEIEDLNIKPKEKEFLFLSESYIQFWERIK
jgi:U4/U6.U5 tri-snRNP-associated protein 2